MTDPIARITTSVGVIEVYPSSDPYYPGVYIDINGKSAALVEYQEEFAFHKIHVWDEAHDEIDTIATFKWDDQDKKEDDEK